MDLLKPYLALLHLQQQPPCQRRVAFEQLRERTGGTAAAALAPHLHITHSRIFCDAHVVDECPEAERTAVRVGCLGALKPAVQLPAIEVCRFLNGPDRLTSDIAQYGLPPRLELAADWFVEFGVSDSGPRVDIDLL